MELKLPNSEYIDILAKLLIAPLMELKYDKGKKDKNAPDPFNRTAYGIEITAKGKTKLAEEPFNRTAYGIEIHYQL